MLEVVDGSRSGAVLPVHEGDKIGRSSECAVVFPDPSVSREHARIGRQGEHFQVIDLDSSNGTFVNGARVDKSSLRDGDRVQVGTVVVCFHLDEEPLLGDTMQTTVRVRQAPDTPAQGPPAVPPSVPPDPPASLEVGVRSKNRPLQYSRIQGGSGGMLHGDLAQRSSGPRFLMYACLGLVAVLAFYGSRWVASSMGAAPSPGAVAD